MSKFNLATIQGKNLVIDITKLLSDEVLYINATKLALQFEKDKYQLRDYFKSNSFLEYENAISKVGKNHHFKTKEIPLRYSVKGKYGGTYLHSDLVIVFLRWLDVEFAIQCDMYIKKTIQQIHNERLTADATAKANKENAEWQEARTKAKATRSNLTDAIKEFCEYAELSRGESYLAGKCPYYIKLTNLVYKSLGIQKPKGARTIRDVFNGVTVERIEHLENVTAELLKDHITANTEYHEAFKVIKKAIEVKAYAYGYGDLK